MRIRDLIDGLKQNKYTVKFLDHWADIKDPMAYFIERMEYVEEQTIEWHKKCCASENTKSFTDVNQDPTELTFVDGGQCYVFFSNYLKLYSYISGEDTYIIINDNEITFKAYGKDESGRIQLYDIQPLPQLKDVPTWQIPVPSGKLTFTNLFDTKVCPEIPDRHSNENSLCGLLGRLNHMKHHESYGVGYGQMSNMSIAIYSNGDEIIITSVCIDDYFDAIDSEYEEEYDKEDMDSAKKLKTYFAEHGFQSKGSICLGVWRYECTDSKVGIPATKRKSKAAGFKHDVVNVPINGNRATGKHYFEDIRIANDLGCLNYCHIFIDKV